MPDRRLASPKTNLLSMESRFLDCGGLLLLAYGSSRSPMGVKGLGGAWGGVTAPELPSATWDGLISREAAVELSLGFEAELSLCRGVVEIVL